MSILRARLSGELYVRAEARHCSRGDRGARHRTQCQFSALRHRLRNYLDKPLGVTIKTSSPPPRNAVCCLWGFVNL